MAAEEGMRGRAACSCGFDSMVSLCLWTVLMEATVLTGSMKGSDRQEDPLTLVTGSC